MKVKKLFPFFSLISQACVQNKIEKKHFEKLSIKSVHITGQTKFSNPISVNTQSNPQIKNWTSHLVITAISSHHPEEKILTQTLLHLRKSYPRIKLLLIPRHPNRTNALIEELLNIESFKIQTYTQNPSLQVDSDIFILNTIGKVTSYIPCANIAFIGGSLIPHGGQSPIEALALNIPILYGPSAFNFQTIVNDLDNKKAIHRVFQDSPLEIAKAIDHLLSNPDKANEMRKQAFNYLKQQQQSAIHTYEKVKRFFS